MDIDPKHTVDRDAQRELFAELLQFKSAARLLRVHDKPGTGKTALLKMLRYRCKYEWDKPVSLVALESFKERTSFELIHKIREDLQPLEFAGFDKLRRAYEKQDALAFQGAGSVNGKVDLRDASVTGGVQAGIATVAQRDLNIQNYYAGGGTWNSGLDKYAEEECIKVFLRELKIVCATQEVVLLLDSWDNDRIGDERQDWLVTNLVRPYSLDATKRPDRLVIVAAGQNVPDFRTNWEGKYSDSVRESPFEVWNKNHVKDFLIVQGFKDLTPIDIDYVWALMNDGASLQEAIDWAVLIQTRRRKAG